ncbi:MAG TPA: hypothetical protein VF429_05900 [Anaerolineae bacterium]
MLQLKLLIGGLLASAVAIVVLVGSLASLSTDVNVLHLALSNPKDAFNSTLSSLSGTGLELETDMTGTVTSTLNLTGTNKVTEAITKYFSGTLTTTVTVSDVVGLRNDGWGFGEIFKLYLLAQESGKSVDQIKALRDSGMGWGEIAKSLDLSPGNKGKNLGAAVSGRGITETLTTNPANDNNSHGNPHGEPPGKSGGGPPPGKGNGKGK